MLHSNIKNSKGITHPPAPSLPLTLYLYSKLISHHPSPPQIRNMIDIIESYSAVQGVKMEGFDSIITKYKVPQML